MLAAANFDNLRSDRASGVDALNSVGAHTDTGGPAYRARDILAKLDPVGSRFFPVVESKKFAKGEHLFRRLSMWAI